jgi:hypothetical protein
MYIVLSETAPPDHPTGAMPLTQPRAAAAAMITITARIAIRRIFHFNLEFKFFPLITVPGQSRPG